MAKGLSRFFDYHILNIKLPGGERSNVSAQGGTHASPCAHLRRGHIRRLNEKHGGRSIWINAVLVNRGNGFVAKDYQVAGKA